MLILDLDLDYIDSEAVNNYIRHNDDNQDNPQQRFLSNPQTPMANHKEVNHGFNSSTEEIVVPIENDNPEGTPATSSSLSAVNSRNIIHVEGANKIYGSGAKSKHVLKDFNMAVQEHTIYGLLGSSGCGKTTILSCIVALRKLNSGTILVCGEPTGTPASGIPGKKVGYMPQEIALNVECTPKEVIAYFGRIYGMNSLQIQERHDYLIKLLSLEECVQPIEQLSDGQKRRVSMSVALIHQPDILILDEPTVGCDPLLREAIWDYLHDLVLRRKATVIVTTHYIEEMRKAARVGIMRGGQLLCQDSPDALLEKYNETLLDNVMVRLCRKNENPDQVNDNDNEGEEEEDTGIRRRTYSRSKSLANIDQSDSIRMQAIVKAKNANNTNGVNNAKSTGSDLNEQWTTPRNQTRAFRAKSVHFPGSPLSTTSFINRMHALVVKNWLVLIRNILFSICLVLLPALTVGVFCLAVGGDPSDLRLGLVNFETSSCLNSDDNYSQVNCTPPTELSCHFINSVDQNIMTFVPFDTVEEAIEATQQRRVWGYVLFRDDFSPNIFKRTVEGDISSNETLVGSEIYLRLDMAGASIGQIIQKLFFEGFRTFVGKLLMACGIDAIGKDLPVTFGPPIFGEVDDQLTNYMGPGVALGFIFFMCALQCGLTYIVEKKDGMLNRTMVAGVSTTEIMLSHFIIQLFIMSLIQIIIAYLIVHIVFKVPLEGSLILSFFLIVLNSIAGMSLGFLLATFCADEKYAMLLAMGMVFPNFLLAGLIWPVQSLPVYLQYINLIMPCTLAGEAYRGILLRGFGIEHHVVWLGFLVTILWITFYWLVIIIWHKLQERKK